MSEEENGPFESENDNFESKGEELTPFEKKAADENEV